VVFSKRERRIVCARALFVEIHGQKRGKRSMKRKQHLLVIGLVMAGSAFRLSAALISDNFNAYATGVNLYTQSSGAWNTNIEKTYFGVNSSGVSGSQGVSVDVQQNVQFGGYTYQTSFAAPSAGTPITFSTDFQFGLDGSATVNRNTVCVGAANGSTANIRLHAQLQRITTNQWRIKSSGGGTLATLTSADMGVASETSGTSNWLRLETSLTKSATDGEFIQTVTLYDLGTTGTDTPSVIQSVAAQTFTDSTLYSAANWYGFIIADRPDDIGMSALSFDNFSVIPEPATVVLFSIASGALMLLRRFFA